MRMLFDQGPSPPPPKGDASLAVVSPLSVRSGSSLMRVIVVVVVEYIILLIIIIDGPVDFPQLHIFNQSS